MRALAGDAHTYRSSVPPVIQPDTFGTEAGPPVVLIPTEREWPGGDEGPDVELRELDDGSLALLAYTSLKALTEGAGPRQPYIEVLPSAIEEIRYALGADVVLWDVALDGAVQHHVLIDEGDGHGQRDRG